MKFNQTIIRFFYFTVSTLLLTSLFLVGCGDGDNDLPDTATVKLEIPSSKVLSPAHALRLIVSTDFRINLSFDDSAHAPQIIYNTKEEFSITQDFDRTFPLHPDRPGIAIELMNTLSEPIRLTLLIDGEVEFSDIISPGTRSVRYKSYARSEVSIF
ncbi:MAG: hypothetical protein OXN17_00220 [Candidatus Poribacteria bacterium]|nr:hypothetical protein [Candidatus Poribacteria bacterium]MDE0503924.1 hypothetical protein [Candidatus Poribacteria bacterium]